MTTDIALAHRCSSKHRTVGTYLTCALGGDLTQLWGTGPFVVLHHYRVARERTDRIHAIAFIDRESADAYLAVKEDEHRRTGKCSGTCTGTVSLRIIHL